MRPLTKVQTQSKDQIIHQTFHLSFSKKKKKHSGSRQNYPRHGLQNKKGIRSSIYISEQQKPDDGEKCTKTQFYIKKNAPPIVKGTGRFQRTEKKGCNHCQLGHTQKMRSAFLTLMRERYPAGWKIKETAQISVRNIPAWHPVWHAPVFFFFNCLVSLPCE